MKKPLKKILVLIAGIAGALLVTVLLAAFFWFSTEAGQEWWKKMHPPAVEKPVVYFYPKERTDVTVVFAAPGSLTVSYPEYRDGWSFTAAPDGTLECEGKEYPYLYYETSAAVGFGERGFTVPRGETVRFLEEKLAAMGFNRREATDFITYWLPRLEANECNRIEFVTGEEADALVPLKITPEPDSILRVFMIFAPCDGTLELEPQVLPVLSREGFTVLEWGGVELSGGR